MGATRKTARYHRRSNSAARIEVSQGAFCQRCARDAPRSASSRTHRLYVEHLIAVLREVRRVLRPDGTLWLVIGDSYAGMFRSVVETLSKSGLSMGVPSVERPTSLSNARGD